METESQKLWIWITEQIAFRSEQFLGMSIPYVIGQWGRKFINRLDRWYSNGSLIPCGQLNVLYNCNYKLCLSFQAFKNERQYLLSTGCRPWLGDLKVFSYVTLLWDSQSIGIYFFRQMFSLEMMWRTTRMLHGEGGKSSRRPRFRKFSCLNRLFDQSSPFFHGHVSYP